MANVAFCGLGSMGLPMAARLAGAGHHLTVWNRTSGKAAPLAERGVVLAATPAEAAGNAEVAITMLATPEALERVVFGAHGLNEGLAPGSILVEMSTVGPEAIRSTRTWLHKEVELLDAPVLGSIGEARSGTLKIFVGGEAGPFDRVRPVLEAMGSPRLVGPLTSGAATKLVVNSTLMALMTALAEALALGDALGLEQAALLGVLSESPIGVTARGKRSRIERGEYPANFKLGLARKDSALVVEEAQRLRVTLPLAEAALSWMAQADEAGLGDLDYSAVIPHIRRLQAGPAGR